MPTPKAQLLSQTVYDTDGSTVVWEFSFAGGYLDANHVKAKVTTPAGDITELTITPANLIGEFQLLITPALAAGNTLTIYRNTPKDLPIVDFTDESGFSEIALDTNAKQAIFVAAETTDALGVSSLTQAAEAAADAIAAAAEAEAAAAAAATSAAKGGVITIDTFSGTGAQVLFTLSVEPWTKNNVTVHINGIRQHSSTWSLTGTALTFSTAPANGVAIEVEIGSFVAEAVITGPAGPTGPQGPVGPAGADGVDGVDGIDGTGTVNSVSVTSANGFAGSVATATTTPAITVTTTVNGLMKGNGTAASAATAGTDYTTPAGTENLSNKRIAARTGTVASSATPTINTDNVDLYSITALAAAITSMTTNLTGTPVAGDCLLIEITDNGTARAITWGAKFEASTVALPTTTVISTKLTVGFLWNTDTSKWRCVAVA